MTDVEEATRITAENLGCTPEQLNNAINHFKRIEEIEANIPKEKLDEIIEDLRYLKQFGPADYDYFELDKFAERLEKFRDEEL